jgi:long-chain-acyl-CoA dehydrogenase
LRDTARQYIEREVAPHADRWERERIVDRSAYLAAGKYGLIGFNMPAAFGGGGTDDFRFNAVIIEELAKFGAAAPALNLQNDIVGPYLKSLATSEQQKRWLPGFIAGEIVGAIAMSEPGAGSDLAGIRTAAVQDGGDWILNGSKTFISSGINADLVIAPISRPGTKVFRCWSSNAGCPGSIAAGSWTKWDSTPKTRLSCISTTSECLPPMCWVR